uniref:predicted GPI-anchored protein 58 n=1 Tax=Fragaria vesca subsp. vesca TaxID=101020 RepID=UPI0005C9A59C|nr:PREDICTED: predicted GPI-anchored protein 58 [Fragaria vesca subsp. vesca]
MVFKAALLFVTILLSSSRVSSSHCYHRMIRPPPVCRHRHRIYPAPLAIIDHFPEEPDPTPQAYAPAPTPRAYAPDPAPRANAPAPTPAPTPAPQKNAPAPAPRANAPTPPPRGKGVVWNTLGVIEPKRLRRHAADVGDCKPHVGAVKLFRLLTVKCKQK